jgi:hypothetical protein
MVEEFKILGPAAKLKEVEEMFNSSILKNNILSTESVLELKDCLN